MEFEGLLLRKVEVDIDVVLAVLDSCVDAVRRCFPAKAREMAGSDIRELVQRMIKSGITSQHVFENPLRPKQLIVFTRLWGAPCWIVLGALVDGERKAITVRMHKDRVFGEEFKEVSENEEAFDAQ